MDRRDLVIIWLSIQIAVMSVLWMKDARRTAYLEGQHDIFEWQSQAAEEACGPYEQPVHKRKGK